MKNTKRIMRRAISLVLVLMMVMSLSFVAVSAADKDTSAVAADGNTKTYYFSPNGYWSNLFAVYAWADGAYDAGEWKELKKVDGVDGLWSVDLSLQYTNAIFCSRTFPAFTWSAVDNKTGEMTLVEEYNYLSLASKTTAVWGYYNAGDLSGDAVETQKVYFVPNADWADIQRYMYHNFVVHAYNAANPDGIWVELDLVEGEYGTYPSVWAAEIPADFDDVTFCRVEGTSADAWVVWEETEDQVIPADSNLFTQDMGQTTGVWSYYVEPEVDPEDPENPGDNTDPTPDTPADPVVTKTIYFTPNQEWIAYINASEGRVSVASFGADDVLVWTFAVKMSEDVYCVEIPEDDNGVVFGVSFGATPDLVWLMTDEQTIPANSNYFVQDSVDSVTGTWKKFQGGAMGVYFSVAFVDWDNTLLGAQAVIEGGSATAPAAPAREDDAQYTYTFSGWDTAFDNVTSNLIVKAEYTATVKSYNVTFIDKDGKTLSTQTVEYGKSAAAPAAPAVTGYEFMGWDTDFNFITGETTVQATYKKVVAPVEPSTTGKLRIELAGGTSFTISVDGGAARPQGASYTNTNMPIGVSVKVTAKSSANAGFMGWMNESGAIVSTSYSYTFNTSGNDYLKATYKTVVDSVNVVIFKNTKAASGNGQILDMQYYAAGDKIDFPAAPTQAGYTFTGWSLTADQIQVALSAGQDVTVAATWEIAQVYVALNVVGGKVTAGSVTNGQALAYNAYTVTADAAPAGQKFACWVDQNGQVMSYDSVYKFYPATDTTLTAVYVASNATIDYEALVFISADPTTDGEKITYVMSWDVSRVGTIKSAGLIIVDKDDYNADTFYHGSGDSKIFDRALGAAQTSQNKNEYSIGKTGSYYDNTYIASAWVIYTDANGVEHTVHSDMVEVYKQAP